MKSVYIKRSRDLRIELFTQPSKFFPYLYFMRIKPSTLLKIHLLLGFINKQYQLVLKYKDQLELRQWQKFVLKNRDSYNNKRNETVSYVAQRSLELLLPAEE